MRLRGGVKRAAVKTEDDEDDAEDDGEVAEGSGAVSALTGVFANVRTTHVCGIVMDFLYRKYLVGSCKFWRLVLLLIFSFL